MLKPLNSKD